VTSTTTVAIDRLASPSDQLRCRELELLIEVCVGVYAIVWVCQNWVVMVWLRRGKKAESQSYFVLAFASKLTLLSVAS